MKRPILVISLFLVLLAGCGKKTGTEYKNIQEKLMSMESYSCNANISYINNKGEDNITASICAMKDGRYRFEATGPDTYRGNVIIFDGKMVWNCNPAAEQKVRVTSPDKPERYELILFSFLENYVNSMDTTVESASIDQSKCTVLEADIPGDNKFIAKEKLWVDNESMTPLRLVIYDDEGGERIRADIEDFQYNCSIDEDKFVVN